MMSWSQARSIGLAAGGAVAVAAAIVAYAHGHGPGGAAKALLAAAIAVAIAAFATTLPGTTLRGTVIGGLFVLAGFSTWTFTGHPLVRPDQRSHSRLQTRLHCYLH